MIIRAESENDVADIREVTAAAFAPKPYSNGTEPAVIDALRASGDLILSLVAVEDDVLLGQITFSPVKINDAHENWFGLGPIAVRPDRQGESIGAALIKVGLKQLQEMNAAGCALIGNPEYYSRFGFQNNCGLDYGDLDTKFIQKLILAGPDRTGALKYCDSFERAVAGS